MRQRRYTLFGDPFSPSGATMMVSGDIDNALAGEAEFETDMVRWQLQGEGLIITPEIEIQLLLMQENKISQKQARLRRQGVPLKFLPLLAATKKKDAQKICASLSLQRHDLAILLYNCNQMGYSKRSQHHKFVPEHLKPTSDEREAFWNNGVGPFSPKAKKFFSKIATTFAQRRALSAHMVEKDSDWHCFYLDYSDALTGLKRGTNHWKKGGPHFHYLSHLWGLSKDEVWTALDSRSVSLPSVHLRANLG